MVTADEDGKVYFRVYRVGLKKSGTKLPRVELTLLGPSIDMKLGRSRAASEELMKQALKVPKELKAKKVKNISTTDLGETVGRVHMQKQDFDQLQSRKVKALKKPKLDKAAKKIAAAPEEDDEEEVDAE